jgi:hypothetical protein
MRLTAGEDLNPTDFVYVGADGNAYHADELRRLPMPPSGAGSSSITMFSLSADPICPICGCSPRSCPEEIFGELQKPAHGE